MPTGRHPSCGACTTSATGRRPRQLVEEHIAAVRGTDVFVCPFMRSGPLIGALIAAHLGDVDRANELIDQVELSDDEPGLPEALRARVLVAVGEAEQGVEAAQGMIDNGRRLASLEENQHEAIALVEGLSRPRRLGPTAGLPARRTTSERVAGDPRPRFATERKACSWSRGRQRTGIELLRRALAGFERLSVPYEVARTKALLADVLPDGDAMLVDAIATAESLMGDRAPRADRPRARRSLVPTTALTAREREILQLIGEGISNQEIADRLVLSLRTVERHVSNIYLKLGLEGRSSPRCRRVLRGQVEPEKGTELGRHADAGRQRIYVSAAKPSTDRLSAPN